MYVPTWNNLFAKSTFFYLNYISRVRTLNWKEGQMPWLAKSVAITSQCPDIFFFFSEWKRVTSNKVRRARQFLLSTDESLWHQVSQPQHSQWKHKLLSLPLKATKDGGCCNTGDEKSRYICVISKCHIYRDFCPPN